MNGHQSNVVYITFSVAMELAQEDAPLGSALNPIVIDSEELESIQMEEPQHMNGSLTAVGEPQDIRESQLNGHGISLEASYQQLIQQLINIIDTSVFALGSQQNPIIIDDDDIGLLDQLALDAMSRTQVGLNRYILMK